MVISLSLSSWCRKPSGIISYRAEFNLKNLSLTVPACWLVRPETVSFSSGVDPTSSSLESYDWGNL